MSTRATVRAQEQSVSVGSNFDGTAPADTAPTSVGDIEKRFLVGTAGGLFDFAQRGPVRLCLVDLKLGGQSTWTLSRVDDQNVATVLWSGTSETSFETIASDEIILLTGDKLKLVTTGTTTVVCRARLGVCEV